jgi:hypothetical protein
MILIVGENGFIAYSEEEFLTMIGNLLSLEPFKLVEKVIIVDFKDKLSLEKSLLDDFIWIPYENIEKVDIDEKRKIEQIIKDAEIVSSDKLTDSEFVEKLRGEYVRFYEYFFPIEFIDLYKKFTRANRKLIIFEEGAYIDNPDRTELFIKQIEIIKPIHDGFFKEGKSIFKFLALVLAQYLPKENKDEEFATKFFDYFIDILQKNDKKYIDIYSSSNSSIPYSELSMRRADYFLEIKSTQKRGESGRKFAKELAQDIINSEFFTAIIEDLDITKPKEIEDFRNEFHQNILQEPSQKQRIINATEIGEIFRKNLASLVPEYLFEILKESARELFKDLKDANSMVTIVLGKDLDFIKYLVSDALRDWSNNSKQSLNALDGLDFSNIRKEFLIIEEFESLEYNDQERLWEEFLKHQDNFKSVIFCCYKKSKLNGSILRHSGIKKAVIPSYEDLKEERYKMFLHLLNRKQPINRKTFEVYAVLPFHFHEFDIYFDGVESFPLMAKILTGLDIEMEEFTYYDLLEPFFWYSFEIYHEEARKAVAEEIKTERADNEKPGKYTVICQDKFWEVRQGQRHLMPIPRRKGFDFLFYLIWYGRIQEDKNQQKEESENGLKRIGVMNLYHNVTKFKRDKKMPEDEIDAGNSIYQSWKNAKSSLKEMLRSNNESGDKKAFIEYLMAFRIAIINYEAAAIVKKGPKNKVSQIEVELGNYFET